MPVYFIVDAHNTRVNIGWHDEPNVALARLQEQSEATLRIARLQPGGTKEVVRLMAEWRHRRIAPGWYRYDRDMFQLTDHLVDRIEMRQLMAERNARLASRPLHPVIADRARVMRHVKLAGSSTKLAGKLNVSPYAVHYWMQNGLNKKALRMLDRLESGDHAAAKRNKIA